MFLLRGILVTCSAFALTYVLLSTAVAGVWPLVARIGRDQLRQSATLLYALRMMPAAISLAVAFGLMVPSFLRYEPRRSEEEMGALLFLLTGLFLLLIAAGIMRAVRACSRTRRWIEQVSSFKANAMGGSGVAMVETMTAGPPVALAGIRHPRLFVSPLAKKLLTEPELACAVAHEVSHARSHDNLKKLLLHGCGFPGTSSLDQAFAEATEFAADRAAATTQSEALDLASALVKIARVQATPELPCLVSGFAQAPATILQARIECLIHYSDEQSRAARYSVPLLALATAVVLSGFTLLSYGSLLTLAHRVTELIVQ